MDTRPTLIVVWFDAEIESMFPPPRAAPRARTRPVSRWAVHASFVIAFGLVAADAHAADAPLRVHFAPNSACADENAFAEQLRARALKIASSDDTPGYDVTLDVRWTGAGYEAKMALVEARGAAGRAPEQPEAAEASAA